MTRTLYLKWSLSFYTSVDFVSSIYLIIVVNLFSKEFKPNRCGNYHFYNVFFLYWFNLTLYVAFTYLYTEFNKEDAGTRQQNNNSWTQAPKQNRYRCLHLSCMGIHTIVSTQHITVPPFSPSKSFDLYKRQTCMVLNLCLWIVFKTRSWTLIMVLLKPTLIRLSKKFITKQV